MVIITHKIPGLGVNPGSQFLYCRFYSSFYSSLLCVLINVNLWRRRLWNWDWKKENFILLPRTFIDKFKHTFFAFWIHDFLFRFRVAGVWVLCFFSLFLMMDDLFWFFVYCCWNGSKKWSHFEIKLECRMILKQHFWIKRNKIENWHNN